MPTWIDPGQLTSSWHPLLLTLATIAAAWLGGRLLAAAAAARLPSWRAGGSGPWPPAVGDGLRARLPFWALLLGIWIASGYWPLTPEGRLFIARALFAVVAMSVTLTAAAVASAMVDACGATLAPTLRVTSLTRNIVWAMVAVTGGLVVLNGLGISITPMLTALGVGGAVMLEVEGGVPAFEPFVRFHTFGDSSVDFTVILRAQEFTGQYLVKHEFVKRLHARFRAEGIVIPFPIRTLHGVPSALPVATAAAPPGG